MLRRILGKLLHVANSDPPSERELKSRFYAVKQRILLRFGELRGHDQQYIEGKYCFSCEGTGGLYTDGGCYRCDGSGWWKPPVVVRLERWRLDRFTFHRPIARVCRKKKTGETFSIEGYVEHASYRLQQVDRAQLLLGIVYDWKLARYAAGRLMNRWRIARLIRRLKTLISRRCYFCKRRLWSTKRYECKPPCRESQQAQKSDSKSGWEIPF
jgi:hypothetical protein